MFVYKYVVCIQPITQYSVLYMKLGLQDFTYELTSNLFTKFWQSWGWTSLPIFTVRSSALAYVKIMDNSGYRIIFCWHLDDPYVHFWGFIKIFIWPYASLFRPKTLQFLEVLSFSFSHHLITNWRLKWKLKIANIY